MADVVIPSFKAFRADRKLIASLTDQPQLIRYLENLGIDASSTTPDLFAQLLTLIIDASESANSAQSTATQVRQSLDDLRNAILIFETPQVNLNDLKQKIDELDNLILGLSLFSAADKTKLNGIVSGAGVVSVSGTAPIISSGGATPAISIDPNPTLTTLTLTNGQLVFPAVQVPSANVNTLDDYFEGTWTPVLSFTTPGNLAVTYSTRSASFTKIGRQVFCNFIVATSAFTYTTASGNLTITGLPFLNGVANQVAGNVDWSGITMAGYTQINPVLVNSTSALIFLANGSGQPRAQVTITQVPTGATVFLSGQISYFV